jgi:hypothetical protein
MPRIFISYRRDDTASAAGRLYDHLSAEFSDENVFRDIYSISPGSDFEKAIADTLDRCEVALVVIGSRWLMTAPGGQRPRIEDPDDFVRREVEAVLGAPGIRVIPVLVERGTLPSLQSLPASLRPLLRRQAVELTDSRWEYDVGRLVDSLTLTPEEASGDAGTTTGPTVWPRRPSVARALVAANLLAVAGLILEVTAPLTPWSALFAWITGSAPALAAIATAVAAVVLFVVRGARERPSQGVMRLMRRLHTWSERRSTAPLLSTSLAALFVAIWTTPEGVTISQRTGPVGAEFCSRFFVDSRMQSDRVQQCPGDRNIGGCGAMAFSCDYYEVRIFTGLLPISRLEAAVSIAGVQQERGAGPASVTWADGALERVNDPRWVFSWGDVGRTLNVPTPQGAVPRMFSILATRQHNANNAPVAADVRVSVVTDVSAKPFEKVQPFTVNKP